MVYLFLNPQKIAAQSSLQIKDFQTILLVAEDPSFLKSNDIKKISEKDAVTLIQLIFNNISSEKFIVYENYPNKKLTTLEVYMKLTQWDSTNTIEDPNHVGVFLNAPVKEETHAQDIPYIIFHEEFFLDSLTFKLEKRISFITLYRYISTQKEGVTGVKKLFDVKWN